MRFALVLALGLCTCDEVGSAGHDLAMTLGCSFPGGRACDGVIGCPDGNGCNWCGCGVASSSALCNQAFCTNGPDGGVTMRPATACTSRRDCALGDSCVFDAGCVAGQMGRCTRIDACRLAFGTGRPPAPGTYNVCGCDGRPTTVMLECGVEQPYRNFGDCR